MLLFLCSDKFCNKNRKFMNIRINVLMECDVNASLSL